MSNQYPSITQDQLDAIATVMDDGIREQLHSAMCPCHPGEFLTAYCDADPSILEVLSDYDTGE